MMATSKEEALARVSKEDEVNINLLTERIEKALLSYSGGYVTINPIGSRKVLDKVAEAYRAVGWSVGGTDTQETVETISETERG